MGLGFGLVWVWLGKNCDLALMLSYIRGTLEAVRCLRSAQRLLQACSDDVGRLAKIERPSRRPLVGFAVDPNILLAEQRLRRIEIVRGNAAVDLMEGRLAQQHYDFALGPEHTRNHVSRLTSPPLGAPKRSSQPPSARQCSARRKTHWLLQATRTRRRPRGRRTQKSRKDGTRPFLSRSARGVRPRSLDCSPLDALHLDLGAKVEGDGSDHRAFVQPQVAGIRKSSMSLGPTGQQAYARADTDVKRSSVALFYFGAVTNLTDF